MPDPSTRPLDASGDDREDRWRSPSLPRAPNRLASGALVVALATVGAALWVGSAVRAAMAQADLRSGLVTAALLVVVIAALALLWPAFQALRRARRAQALTATDIPGSRVLAADARTAAAYTFGYAATVVIVLAVAMFIIANQMAVGQTFFYLPLIGESFWLVLDAFWTNIYIFMVAEVLVLVWGLVVAIARLAPGAPGRPIRLIATVYTDIFRGLPAIICIYLVGFGLPLTGLPIVKDFPPAWYAILALTLTYGAYVAEVYRSGIDSVHWSQTAGARSLGLSFGQTLRFVVVPQAVRRIIPPLLNDFISLQKDTALVNVIGAIDAFNQAKIVASNHFNLSSVTTVAFLFVLITIPQARFVDRLLERDQRRTRAGG